MTKKEAIALGSELFPNGELALLRQCAKFHLEYPTGTATNRLHEGPKAIRGLIGKIKGIHIDEAHTIKEYREMDNAIGHPENYGN